MSSHLIKQFAVLIFFTLIMTSCGRKSETIQAAAPKPAPRKVETINRLVTLNYISELQSLNTSLAGLTTGQSKIKVDGDLFEASVIVKNAPTFTTHKQAIFHANRCPEASDDLNGDSLIDPVEFEKAIGVVLIPLDGDLSSQEALIDVLPESDGVGNYTYYQSTSFAEMMADLTAIDPDPKDDLMKLPKNKKFSFDDRIIVIFGVQPDVYLPPTVDGPVGAALHDLIPVACGKYQRLVD